MAFWDKDRVPTREEAIDLLCSCSGDPEKMKQWNDMRSRFECDVFDLTNADLRSARLMEADLEFIDLTRSDLLCVNLMGADLQNCDLTSVNLREANLSHANLRGAVLIDANLEGANLSEARVTDVAYNRRGLNGRCKGVRAATCYGHPLFKRDIEDQCYIDALRTMLMWKLGRGRAVPEDAPGGPLGPRCRWDHIKARWHWMWFRAWEQIDCGRSFARVGVPALCFALAFGTFFYLDQQLSWGFVGFERSANSWLTPFYYSIVTYTTLGFGDVTPKHWFGELVVIAEVILGYLTLGLLVSILANKVARRA